MKVANGVWFWWVFRLKPPTEGRIARRNEPEAPSPLDTQGEKEV